MSTVRKLPLAPDDSEPNDDQQVIAIGGSNAAAQEDWRAVPGYAGYEASTLGNIRSWRRRGPGTALRGYPLQLRPTVALNGYLVVSMRDGKTSKQVRVHVAVLLTFVGERPLGAHGCHGDGNKANNRLINLRWDSARENNADRARHGRLPRGAAVFTAKLTIAKVHDIRSRPKSVSNAELAREFGLSAVGLGRVRKGKAWAHV